MTDQHHAIIVTSSDEEKIKLAHKKATEYYFTVSIGGLTILTVGRNPTRSFFIPPQDVLPGATNSPEQIRQWFTDWLTKEPGLDWVEVMYGDGVAGIVSHGRAKT